MRLIRHVRQTDQRAFQRWLRSANTDRTRVVGLVLLAFAVFWVGMTAAGVIEDSPLLFGSFLFGLIFGLTLIHFGRKQQRDTLTQWGQLVILAVAILWMFSAVYAQADDGHGLVEFVIGTLALAMLRVMKPITAAITFSMLIMGYTIVLIQQDMLALSPVNNGILFCLFAYILSVANYNSTVLAFRNHLLVRQLNQQNQQLATLAMRDSLTGLPNRRFFDQLLDRYWHVENTHDLPVNLILLDIDKFKEYNDRHGHPAGDQCLRQVADIINTTLRREATCCRLGGEEFAILQRGISHRDALVMAERLREQVANDSDITFSLSVATTHPADMSSEDLFLEADKALYSAKSLGRNRVVDAMAHKKE